MQGFLTTDFKDQFSQAVGELSNWVRTGSIRYREEILDGIEYAPGSMQRLYSGENNGKLVMRLRDQAE